MLQPQTVIKTLVRLLSHYPNCGHSEETLQVVAEDWYETFHQNYTDAEFVEAVKVARRQCRFFPTEKDVFGEESARGGKKRCARDRCEHQAIGTCKFPTATIYCEYFEPHRG